MNTYRITIIYKDRTYGYMKLETEEPTINKVYERYVKKGLFSGITRVGDKNKSIYIPKDMKISIEIVKL